MEQAPAAIGRGAQLYSIIYLQYDKGQIDLERADRCAAETISRAGSIHAGLGALKRT